MKGKIALVGLLALLVLVSGCTEPPAPENPASCEFDSDCVGVRGPTGIASCVGNHWIAQGGALLTEIDETIACKCEDYNGSEKEAEVFGLPHKKWCTISSNLACPEDAKVCPDGSTVSRNPELGCEFDPCPTAECAGQGQEFSEELDCCTGLVKAVNTCEKCREEGEALAFDGIPCCQGLEAVDGLCRTPGEELPCREEGETIPVIANPPECCQGLELIPPKQENILGITGICTAKCGNGECDSETESNHNCPIDCPPEDSGFCGWSTGDQCENDSDCESAGCSGQVCAIKGSEIVTTCEARECYNNENYGLECGCVQGKCSWRQQ